MGSTVDYIEFVCEQINGVGDIRYRKMFGEYMVYVNEKPVLLVCDNTVYVKKLDCVQDLMKDADEKAPYDRARLHYILDIEDSDLAVEVVRQLEKVILVPKPKKR